MHRTKRQKVKARRSREANILSDIKNQAKSFGTTENALLDQNLENLTYRSNCPHYCGNVLESPKGEFSSLEGEFQLMNKSKAKIENQISKMMHDCFEILSREMNHLISREFDDFRSSVNTQLQGTIEEAISGQVLSLMKSTLRNIIGTIDATSETVEEPEQKSEGTRNRDQNTLNNSNNGSFLALDKENQGQSHYMVTGASNPNVVPEFLTGHARSQSNSHPPHCKANASPNATISEDKPQMCARNQVSNCGISDILSISQNHSSLQSVTSRPVIRTEMASDNKTAKFDLFENHIDSRIKVQKVTENLEREHFRYQLLKNYLQTLRTIETTNHQTLEDVLIALNRSRNRNDSQAKAKNNWNRPVLDPTTKKPPDVQEGKNQSTETAFGEKAKKVADSLSYAKFTPKLNCPVEMKGTCGKMFGHLEREFELHSLQESHNLRMATKSDSSKKVNEAGAFLSSGIGIHTDCNYCKEIGHVVSHCKRLQRKKIKEAKNVKSNQKNRFPECPNCGKTSHPENRCWKGAGAHLRPKGNKRYSKEDRPTENDNENTQNVSKRSTSTSNPKFHAIADPKH